MKSQSIVIPLFLSACLAFSASAQVAQQAVSTPNTAGVGVNVEIQGRITVLDPQQQRAVITGPKGNAIEVFWGDNVRNAAQMAVGDTVSLRYQQALLLSLNKVDGQGPATREVLEQSARSQAGDKPGAVKVRTVRLRANIVAMDAARGTLVLQGVENTIELGVERPELLAKVKVGDRVEATYRDALAVEVTR